QQGRGILGVVDGSRPRGVEGVEEARARHDFVRKIGYKLRG
ncbi:MAG: adenosine-specific kinase, partial [Candidatus Acidiferrales bacterium]